MTRMPIFIVAVLGLSLSLVAQDIRQASVTLKAAQAAEQIEQDLPKAIALYERAAKEAGSDRVLAAQILLQLAQAQTRAGRASDARATYERVVREYADSGEPVSAARARLKEGGGGGAGANVAGVGTTTRPVEASRLVWTLPSETTWVRGDVSPNGQYLTIATPGGELLVHDLRIGADRVIARPSPKEPDVFLGATAFSQDSRKLVYEVGNNSNGRRLGLRLVSLDEPGLPASKHLIDADVLPCDWSPDGKWIAVTIRTGDTSLPARRDPQWPWQLGLVSVADGSVRVLKTIEARYRSRLNAAFSPDGASVAFEVPEDQHGARDIVVLSVNGGAEMRAVDANGDDALIGWTPDGAGVLFSSARGSGTPAIWLQRLAAGKRYGAAERIRSDGPSWPLGITTAGALYWGVDNDAGVSVKSTTFDSATGKFLSAIEDVPSTFVRSSRRPRWSPDGKLLGYVSLRGDKGGDVFVTRNVETGEVREVRLDIYFRNGNRNLWFWVPDSHSILTIAEDPDPAVGVGLFRTDLLTGKTTLIVARNLGNQNPQNALEWSPDGRTLIYSYLAGPGRYLRVSRDLATGAEQEVARKTEPRSPDGSKEYVSRRIPSGVAIIERVLLSGSERELLKLVGYSDWFLTADGQSIIGLTTDLATNEGLVVIHSVAEGGTKTLFKSQRGQTFTITALAPDERSVVVQFKDFNGSSLFWWVPTDGRPARLLQELSGFEDVAWAFHPDGRRVALQINYRRTVNDQIFVLENFLPATKR